MRKLILSVAVVTVAGGLFFGCDSQTRTDSANRNESTQSTKTDVTNDAAASEFRRYRLDSEDQLSQTDREIEQIRKRIVSENMSNRKDLEDRLQKIEKKNDDLKEKLADFKDDADVGKTDNFRKDFNEDITEVRQDVTNFWTNNTDSRKDMNRDNSMKNENENKNTNPLR